MTPEELRRGMLVHPNAHPEEKWRVEKVLYDELGNYDSTWLKNETFPSARFGNSIRVKNVKYLRSHEGEAMAPEELKAAGELMIKAAENPEMRLRVSGGPSNPSLPIESFVQLVSDCHWNWSALHYEEVPAPREIWVNEYPAPSDLCSHSSQKQAEEYATDNCIRKAVHYREVVDE